MTVTTRHTNPRRTYRRTSPAYEAVTGLRAQVAEIRALLDEVSQSVRTVLAEQGR
jgi:hypothetical protein